MSFDIEALPQHDKFLEKFRELFNNSKECPNLVLIPGYEENYWDDAVIVDLNSQKTLSVDFELRKGKFFENGFDKLKVLQQFERKLEKDIDICLQSNNNFSSFGAAFHEDFLKEKIITKDLAAKDMASGKEVGAQFRETTHFISFTPEEIGIFKRTIQNAIENQQYNHLSFSISNSQTAERDITTSNFDEKSKLVEKFCEDFNNIDEKILGKSKNVKWEKDRFKNLVAIPVFGKDYDAVLVNLNLNLASTISFESAKTPALHRSDEEIFNFKQIVANQLCYNPEKYYKKEIIFSGQDRTFKNSHKKNVRENLRNTLLRQEKKFLSLDNGKTKIISTLEKNIERNSNKDFGVR